VVRKGGFGDHVNRKRIFSDYVGRRAGDYFTTILEKRKWINSLFEGPVKEKM
jgi:hypothetical protein